MCGAPDQDTLEPVVAGKEAVVQGRVVRDGSPLGGAYVRLLDSTGEFTAEVQASATGQFRFFAAPGTWTLRVLAPGTSPVDASVTAATGEVAEATIEVPA
ncbi:MAG: hypothetical protein JWO60_1348 [Frankiales bacterium]|nr:hypothetical protein [Frankiales bacterium]